MQSNRLFNSVAARLVLAISILFSLGATTPPDSQGLVEPAAAGPNKLYLPITIGSGPVIGPVGPDWPQLAHDAQRTGYSSEQVDPPYCYAWKWNAVPIASRAQPVVKNGILFIGGLDGRLYARVASSGEPIWNFTTGGPIRHTPAASGSIVITGSYDGYTYALSATTGDQIWRTFTGSSATAPLVDETHQRVYVASTYGFLTALNLNTGGQLWQYDAKAAILTSPSLSVDGSLVYFGSEAMNALAVNSDTGAQVWKTKLQGQSLAERYPVVAGDAVIYRSQPYFYFHNLLQQWGDDVMDEGGSTPNSNWAADWATVKSRIVNFLNQEPNKQTFFVLNASNGSSRGTAPVLYTYGSNDIANVPVVTQSGTYITYRARHGIQTDFPNIVHVTTKYDAELGKMDLNSLDITGLTTSSSLTIPLTGGTAFRMTSDEAAMLTMGGNILWVDNWERLGGINVSNGQIVHAGNVSNNWPECWTQCGAAGPRPFYPLSGNPNDAAYPFPGPRTSEGHARAGAVIANNMVYWRVVDAGLAAFKHSSSSCSAPAVWTDAGGPLYLTNELPAEDPQPAAPALQSYVTNDRTAPVAVTSQNQDLVNRLNKEITDLLAAANNNHMMPYYLERGMSNPQVWPYNSTSSELPEISVSGFGNTYWHDPGEFLLSMAMAYPYLTPSLKTQLKTYVLAEMGRYPPLQSLPHQGPCSNWLCTGSPRELNPITIRANLNNWPPVATNMSAIYAVWLWSKNTGDWAYATSTFNQATSLFNARKGSMNYYADIAGAIGYYRLATQLNNAGEATAGMNAAVAAMNTGLNFNTFRDRANTAYPDPRQFTTGWSAPVFYGMTPEVGLYLREQFNTNAATYLLGLESLDSNGNGLVWWYFTRSGEHGENGETSFLTPLTAWSHFLGHAYIVGDHQPNLRKWLDRPWAPGDVYSIQKIVAALQAPP